MAAGKVNILLVDDQPAKLISHQAVLQDLNENLLCASSAREAFEILLKNEVAVILIDVCMPETDGFELATLIQGHPRFEKTAVIFISAVLFNEVDRLRGYEIGAVDYVTVPVIPEVLRAKVKVFVELYRKTQQLEQLNRNLEARVAERTAEVAASAAQLRQAEQLHGIALAAGQMGSWEWDVRRRTVRLDQGQCDILGVDRDTFVATRKNIEKLIHPDDLKHLAEALISTSVGQKTFQAEFRVLRPDGQVRWCSGAAAASFDDHQRLQRLSGVTVDNTERKRAEERLVLLAEEVDHRARNVVAVIQAIMRLTRSRSIDEYIKSLDGRISALSTAHKLLATSRWEGADLRRLVNEEIAPYAAGNSERIEVSGQDCLLPPSVAQTIALVLHELVTNAAKYGALSVDGGRIRIAWAVQGERLEMEWSELNVPRVKTPRRTGYGTRVIRGGIEGQLGGKAHFNWKPDGLQCKLVALLDTSGAATVRERRRSKQGATHAAPAGKSNGGPRASILVVEDEPMISMMLTDILTAQGHYIDGPHSSFSDALAAASNNDLQVGILDINLRGKLVFPIADVLIARDIPFIFVTGYAADTIVDSAYAHVPVLQKPIVPEAVSAALEQIMCPSAVGSSTLRGTETEGLTNDIPS